MHFPGPLFVSIFFRPTTVFHRRDRLSYIANAGLVAVPSNRSRKASKDAPLPLSAKKGGPVDETDAMETDRNTPEDLPLPAKKGKSVDNTDAMEIKRPKQKVSTRDEDEDSSLSEDDNDEGPYRRAQKDEDGDFVAEDGCDPLVDDGEGPETSKCTDSYLNYRSHASMADDDEDEEEPKEPVQRASSLPAPESPGKRGRSTSLSVRTRTSLSDPYSPIQTGA